MSTEIVAQKPARPAAAFGPRGIVISEYDQLVRFAQTVHSSGLAPQALKSPEAIFVAVQMGMEVGLTPMASLQNVAVVHGRPALWGDAILAVCRGTGELEVFEEWYEVDGKRTDRNPARYEDSTAGVCRVKRAGGSASEVSFSVSDAKTAGLWGKAGSWTQYPFRMLRYRARAFALRDSFGDSLRGFRSVEEAEDTLPEPRMAAGREILPAAVPAIQKALLSPKPEKADPRTELQKLFDQHGIANATIDEFLRTAGEGGIPVNESTDLAKVDESVAAELVEEFVHIHATMKGGWQ